MGFANHNRVNPSPSDESTTEKQPIASLEGLSEKKLKSVAGERFRFDPKFKGPLSERKCRDIFFLFLFLAYLGGVIYVSVVAWAAGDIRRIINGEDSFGNICGVDNRKRLTGQLKEISQYSGLAGRDLTDRPYVYWYGTNIFDAGTTRVCVKQCPDGSYFEKDGTTNIGYHSTKESTYGLCSYDVNASDYSLYDDVHADSVSDALSWFGLDFSSQCQSGTPLPGNDGRCPTPIVSTVKMLNRCIPCIGGSCPSIKMNATDIASIASNATASSDANPVASFFMDALQDLSKAWQEILYGFMVAFAFALFCTVAFRFIAGAVVWGSMIVVLLGLAGIAGWLWLVYAQKKNAYDSFIASVDDAPTVQGNKHQINLWMVAAIVVTIIWSIVFLIIVAMRTRIKLAITVFKEAGAAITQMPFIIAAPLWTLIAATIATTAFGAVMLCIHSASTYALSMDMSAWCERHLGTNPEGTLFWLGWYEVFGWLWIINVILAINQCVIAGGIATYYWTRPDYEGRKKVTGWPVLRSLARCLRFHLGSLALGAMIVAVVQFIRIVLAYLQKQLGGAKNPVLGFLFKCLGCCFWCLEKIIKFINKNAYIEIAVYGYSFCKAARTAFNLLFRNILRVAILSSVSDFCLFIMKISIIASGGALTGYLAAQRSDVTYVWVPILLVVIACWIMAKCFISVYEMAISTTFLCFLEDEERNDGSIERPYYMSDNLLAFVDGASHEQNMRKKQRELAKIKIPNNKVVKF